MDYPEYLDLAFGFLAGMAIVVLLEKRKKDFKYSKTMSPILFRLLKGLAFIIVAGCILYRIVRSSQGISLTRTEYYVLIIANLISALILFLIGGFSSIEYRRKSSGRNN